METNLIKFEPYDTKTAALAPVIHFVHVKNALMPSASRAESTMPWEQAKPVAAYLNERFPLGHELLSVSLNGRVLAAVEREHVTPRAGDWIVATPMVAGGGVWRTLAMVAVMVAAIAVPEFLIASVAAWSFFGSTALALMIGGAISMAGNMLINALMPLNPSTKAQPPSWAFNGPKTLAQPGVVIPKGYGTFQSGGNVIASFVDIEGTNQYINALVCYGFGPARSITNIQINNRAISEYNDVQAYVRYGSNDQAPLPAFNRVVNGYPQQMQVMASGNPVVVPGTGNVTQALQVDVQFPAGVYYTSGDGNNLPMAIVYQVQYALSGTHNWQSVLMPKDTYDVVKYHTDGTVDWGQTPTWVLVWTGGDPASGVVLKGDNGPHKPGDQESVTQSVTLYQPWEANYTSTQTFQGEWQPIDVTLNQVEVTSWFDGWVRYVNDTTQVTYNRTSIYGLAPGRYDVRVTKFGSGKADGNLQMGDFDDPKHGQELWVHNINEITYQDLSYPNMILVGIRALATNQINGSDINITALIEYGLRSKDLNLLPAALQAYGEENPACVAADMMLDPLYGGGAGLMLRPSNIERFIDEWLAWANNNETLVPDGNGNNIRLHVFNGIFDNEDNLWNQVQAVAKMSRAALIPMGRDYGVFVNMPDVPVQMFSVGNIKQDSFEETWMALDDRANQIEVEFTDSTRFYKTDNPIVYMDAADQAAGVVVKNVRIKGMGITVPAQAWHYGRFLGLSNKLLLRTGKFECDVDAIACRPGNLVYLQHDVPQWGWGGRTLSNATASQVSVDRNDLPWDGTTAYNLIVLFPAIQRWVGTVTYASVSTDSTGLTVGTLVNLANFTNQNRVTRAVINGVDCPILSASAGQILITPPPGFTPAASMACTLFDTDVLETATVSGVASGPNNSTVLTLGVPFTQAPEDFSVYFYGQPGAAKKVRVTNIRRQSDERRVIEWMDADDGIFAIGTPVVGETSAEVTTNPGVTDLTAVELLEKVQGTYVDYASLTWKWGPNTYGVLIFGSYPGLAQPKVLACLTGYPKSWKYQISPTVSWTFTVVGFDQNNNCAPFASAPSVQLTGAGVTQNLLLGSTFQNGFAYWSVFPRAGDTLVPTLGAEGEADYTVLGSALVQGNPQLMLTQLVQNGDGWSVGGNLILSAYAETQGTPTGNLVADIAFQNAVGGQISTARAVLTMSGAASGLTRINTGVVTVPANTDSLLVRVLCDGNNLNLPVGTVITLSHFLLEVPVAGQTLPSVWADVDALGNVLDTFQLGSSASLRTQGSTLPVTTGQISWSLTPTTATISWYGLVIVWPDGGYTQIQDGAFTTITGLTASTAYYFYLFYDVVNGGVIAAVPGSPVGSPAILSASIDANCVAACRLDGRCSLTPAYGATFTTPATGTSTGSTGTAFAAKPRPRGGPILPVGGVPRT